MGMKQKIFLSLENQKSKKNLGLQNLAGLIDANGIDVAQPIWS